MYCLSPFPQGQTGAWPVKLMLLRAWEGNILFCLWIYFSLASVMN